jgi:hypothetical protein
MQKKKPSNLCKKRDFKGSIKMMNLFDVGVYSNSFFNFFKLIIFYFLNSPIAARGREVLKSAKYNIISKIPYKCHSKTWDSRGFIKRGIKFTIKKDIALINPPVLI